MPVVLVGTLDTKGTEFAFVRDLLHLQGLATLVVDAGSLGPPTFPPDVPREQVFQAAGTTFNEIRAHADRGEAVAAAARGAAIVLQSLASRGRVQGVLGLGGSAGTVIGTAAMRALPFGLPKVMVSTLASGQTRPYVAGSDILMMYPVADLAGLNRITRASLTNAALALAGMVNPRSTPPPSPADRPLVAATMFGVTTPCVDHARRILESNGLEIVVFHTTGVGGQSMEGLVRDGQLAGLLDLTTTELADELVGGILSAGPHRLEAAINARIPQVVSLGALDMVNFGPRETVPDRFANRLFYNHNPSVTLMRTTPEENAALGQGIARVLAQATAPLVLMIPLKGLSALDAPNAPFYNPTANRALFSALNQALANHPFVRLQSRDEHINDPSFAQAAAENLLALMGTSSHPLTHP